MSKVFTICKRELNGYFATPIAYVFIVIFLLLSGVFTFYFGNFFTRGQADLVPFFQFHPWVYMIFMPALTMRLWAEERRSGTIELLLTLPITTREAVLGKFLAAWVFSGIALALTFPIWLSVNYLGQPDNGIIFAGYVGSFIMAGGFLAIGSCVSAITKNQVIAFIITIILCLIVNLSGFPMVTDQLQGWVHGVILDTIRGFSFITNFDSMSKGLIDVRSIVFFASLIMFWLFANVVIIESKKAD